jgi:hypothetical protein
MPEEISVNQRVVDTFRNIMSCFGGGTITIPETLYDEMLKYPPMPIEIVQPLLDLEVRADMGARKKLRAIRVLLSVQRKIGAWEKSVVKAGETKTGRSCAFWEAWCSIQQH